MADNCLRSAPPSDVEMVVGVASFSSPGEAASCTFTRTELMRLAAESGYGTHEAMFSAYFRRTADGAVHCLACSRAIGSHAEQQQNADYVVAAGATDGEEPPPVSTGTKPYRPIIFAILALACFGLDVAALTQPLYAWIDRPKPSPPSSSHWYWGYTQTSCWETCATYNPRLPSECRAYPDDDPCVKQRFNALRAFGVLSCIFAFLGGVVIAPVMDFRGKLTGCAGKLVLVATATVLLVFQTVYWGVELSIFYSGCGSHKLELSSGHRQISSTLFMASTGVAFLMIFVALLSEPSGAPSREAREDAAPSREGNVLKF